MPVPSVSLTPVVNFTGSPGILVRDLVGDARACERARLEFPGCSMREISKRQDKEQSYKAHKYCNPTGILERHAYSFSSNPHSVREITLTSLIAYLAEPERHPNPDIESLLPEMGG